LSRLLIQLFPIFRKLYDWLLEVDLGIKGSNTLDPGTQLERLIVRLARPATATA